TDTGTLVTAINQAIVNAGNGASQQATAFKNANITASINPDSSGEQQLAFRSSTDAFQVAGADQVSTAFLGNLNGTAGQGNSAVTKVSTATAFLAPTAGNIPHIRILGAGLTGSQGDIAITQATTDTQVSTIAAINTAIAGNAALKATGIKAVDGGSSTIAFVGGAGQSFEVQTSGDVTNSLGYGSFLSSNGNALAVTANTFDYNTITA